MVRKNISVGVDTWNALAAFGKFGQTFDDVIKILLKEREECLRNHRQQQPQQEGVKISQSLEVQQLVKQNPELQHRIHLLEIMPMIIRINLPGLKFPANKNEIIECAEKANQHQIVDSLKILPDRVYKSPEDIEKEKTLRGIKLTVKKFFEEVNKNLGVKRSIGKITVDTREIRQDQRKQLLQQQEQEFAQITK